MRNKRRNEPSRTYGALACVFFSIAIYIIITMLVTWFILEASSTFWVWSSVSLIASVLLCIGFLYRSFYDTVQEDDNDDNHHLGI